MLDSVLKYVSLIIVAGAAISFGVGFWKYLDQRKREERTKRFQLFHDSDGPRVRRGRKPWTQTCADSAARRYLRAPTLYVVFVRIGPNFATPARGVYRHK